MSKKYTWKDIRSKLSKCSERDLIGLIGDLYKLNKDNKNFLNTMFYNDESAITQYQEVISKSLIFEPYEAKPKLAVARKAIMDYKKAKGITPDLIELMLHYLDCGSIMASNFGYYEGGYFESMFSMYKGLEKIFQTNPELESLYQKNLQDILRKYKDTGYFEQ